ncbi:MAG: class I SAM-dependent methyltransferase [Terriglobales bacterium]
MSPDPSEYANWRGIDYRPALPEIPLNSLAPYLCSGQTVLEIGCNTGRTALQLERRGLEVIGIDINAEAILQARAAAKILDARVRFIEGDFLERTDLGKFDLVVMVRVLTCFSKLEDWRALLTRSLDCVAPAGLIYVHDFLPMPENDSYRKRYREGVRQGWRTGNFAVPAKDGSLLFIAHHHSAEELSEIMNPYATIFLNIHDSVSLNGNACRMFEFLGKRKAAA